QQRQGWRVRSLRGRPPRLHLRLPEEGRRRLRRAVGRTRGDAQGDAQRQDAGGADRHDQGPALPAARPVRQRGSRTQPGGGQPARGRAQEARQELRVPPLRRRRPRLLLLAPAALPGRPGDGRLEQGVGLLRQAPEVGAPNMCTSIIEITDAEGMAKRGDGWFPLTQAVVAYDHARHALLGDVITLDFFNTRLGADARAGGEITLESAQALRAALDPAIAAAEVEGAEVRRKGPPPTPGRAAWRP